MSQERKVEKQFDSIRELSEKMGKSYRTVHRAVQDKKIKAITFGGSRMIPKQEVERVLANGF